MLNLEYEDLASPYTRAFFENVNIFTADNVMLEASAGPMICNKDIKLSRDEVTFLEKGPRSMFRQDAMKEDFAMEVEKKIDERKYQSMESEGGKGEDEEPEKGDNTEEDERKT